MYLQGLHCRGALIKGLSLSVCTSVCIYILKFQFSSLLSWPQPNAMQLLHYVYNHNVQNNNLCLFSYFSCLNQLLNETQTIIISTKLRSSTNWIASISRSLIMSLYNFILSAIGGIICVPGTHSPFIIYIMNLFKGPIVSEGTLSVPMYLCMYKDSPGNIYSINFTLTMQKLQQKIFKFQSLALYHI